MSKCSGYVLCICAVCSFIISFPLYAVQSIIPQQVLGWQKTAQELTDQGNISQAYEYYQKIIQFNADSSDLSVMRKSLPTMPRDVFSLGKLFENDAQYDKALELYQAGVNWPVSGDKSQGIWNDPAF